jgi:hypothetical protein
MINKLFKISVFYFFALIVLFIPCQAQDINLSWNTFLGSMNWDESRGVALDNSGNIYIVGTSENSWGSPNNPFSGDLTDTFVACVDRYGNLVWNTFLGSSSFDYGMDIALDDSGNIFVTGYSSATWGIPFNAHNGFTDAFVACLDSNGELMWNTFLGCFSFDYSYGIALGSSGDIYVIGLSYFTWGSPINPHNGEGFGDVFVACLNSSGEFQWNTFLGSGDYDCGLAIALDNSCDIFVTGYSDSTWGLPVNAHSGDDDAFVASLNSSGELQWNTFLGNGETDTSYCITLDSLGNIYVTGFSYNTWGTPINAFVMGSTNNFVACLDRNGNLNWNTFMGSMNGDVGLAIALDSLGYIYVTGRSLNTWGSPVNVHNGGWDAFVACLDNNGNLNWNTFLGSGNGDYGHGIVLDSLHNIYVTGSSWGTWGTPVNGFNGGLDAFITKLSQTYRITASVSSGKGSISPAIQDVNPGKNAVINIKPDPGFRIKSITDNGVLKPIANPYIIKNVHRDHNVVITFELDVYLPAINLSALRKIEKAWIIQKQYGEISIEIIEHSTNPMPISRYILYRKDNKGWTQVSEYSTAGSYIYIDKSIEIGKQYSYKVSAMGTGGTVIVESNIVII